MLVKGFSQLKEGEYQGHKYANYTAYGTDDKGYWIHEKVAKKVFDDAGVYDVNALIGNEVDFYYNRFGKIEKVVVRG